jgi:hypothetical protein
MRTFGVIENLRKFLKAKFLPVIWGLPLPLDGGYCCELVIEHHVKLGGNAAGAHIQYLRHLNGVLHTEAHKHSSSGSWLPSRQLAALFHVGIEDVFRASPYMHIHEAMPRNCAVSEYIQGREAILWGRVLDVSGVCDCYGPYT